MRNRKRIIIYSSSTLAIMIAIFMFSCQNGEQSVDVSNSLLVTAIGRVLEKVLPPLTGNGFEADIREYAHMFEYGCLGTSMSLLCREIILKRRWIAWIVAEMACFIYACSDEFHQTFVPDRVGTFADVGVDAVGFTTGVMLVFIVSSIYVIMRKRRMAKKNENKKETPWSID